MKIEEFSEILQISSSKTDQALDKTQCYSERCYQNVLLYFLKDLDAVVSKEVNIPFKLDCGFTFGYGKADIVIETEEFVFILELKANVDLRYSKKYAGQVLKYAEHFQSAKPRIPYLVIFGPSSPIIKRLP